jgi:hypothetical protein
VAEKSIPELEGLIQNNQIKNTDKGGLTQIELETEPLVGTTLFNDPNPEDRKLMVFVSPTGCHNLYLERHEWFLANIRIKHTYQHLPACLAFFI